MKRQSLTNESPRFSSGIKKGLSHSQRRDLGKSARKATSLASHDKLHIRKTGRDIVDILEESNVGRIQELIPIRFGRMLVSPFNFFRGSAGIMAFDLASTPVSGFRVQACGDCHIQNFGGYATPERQIAIDINDFDETLPAPWEWDVKRLAASLVLAATANGFSAELGQDAARRMAGGYRDHMAELSEMNLLDVWYSMVDYREVLSMSKADDRKRRQKLVDEARAKSAPEVMMEKLTVISNGKVRFKDIPPLIMHVEGVSAGEQEKAAFEEYCKTLPDFVRVLLDKFELVDISRKVVGVGSVGTMCGVLLLASSDEDVLVLQLKEARKSVLEPFAGTSLYEHCGQRVVNGQKLMQAASDMFLGWTTGHQAPFRQFYLRQLRDVKIAVNTALWTKDDFKSLPRMAGEILARSHARSGDPSVFRGYLGRSDEFDEAVASYGAAYAKQVEHDYDKFVKACRSGVLNAQPII